MIDTRRSANARLVDGATFCDSDVQPGDVALFEKRGRRCGLRANNSLAQPLR